MERKFSEMNLHQKLESIVKEMVEKELSLKDARNEFERIFFDQTSKKYEGNRTKMAKALGIHRNTLHNRTKTLKPKRRG